MARGDEEIDPLAPKSIGFHEIETVLGEVFVVHKLDTSDVHEIETNREPFAAILDRAPVA